MPLIWEQLQGFNNFFYIPNKQELKSANSFFCLVLFY